MISYFHDLRLIIHHVLLLIFTYLLLKFDLNINSNQHTTVKNIFKMYIYIYI